jgi:hypothetical protein
VITEEIGAAGLEAGTYSLVGGKLKVSINHI